MQFTHKLIFSLKIKVIDVIPDRINQLNLIRK